MSTNNSNSGAPKADFSGVTSSVSSTEQIVSQSSAAPPPPPAPAAATHTVARGDTLSAIAKKHLGNANAWREIFELNRDILKDPDKIQPGQVLKLPARQS